MHFISLLVQPLLESIYTRIVAMAAASSANLCSSPPHKSQRVGEAFEPWDNDSLGARGEGASSQVPPLPFGQSSLEKQVSALTLLVQQMAAMQMQHMQAVQVAQVHGPSSGAPGGEVPLGQPTPITSQSTASRHPMEVDADPVAMFIQSTKSKGVNLPNELLMKMKSESAKFGKALKNLSRSRTFKQKLEKRLEDLRAGRVPPGIKPWKCNDESPIWRLPLGDEAAATLPFKITGEDEITKVKATLSVEFHTCNAVVDLRFEQLKILELERSCSLNLFITKCVALAEPFHTSLSDTTSGLGLPPGLCDGWIEQVKCEAVKFYKWQVEAAARDSQKLKEQSERQTREQKEVLDKAAKLSPHEVLGKAVAAMIQKPNQRAKTKDKIDYVSMLNIDVQEPSLLKQKNGSSPQAAGGPNNKKNGTMKEKSTKSLPNNSAKTSKGKGKGKGAPGSGKGKGKGKSKSSGKGKSKDEKPKTGAGKGRGKGRGRGQAGAKGNSRG